MYCLLLIFFTGCIWTIICDKQNEIPVAANQYREDVYPTTADVRPQCVKRVLDVQRKRGKTQYLVEWEQTRIPNSLLNDLANLLEQYTSNVSIPKRRYFFKRNGLDDVCRNPFYQLYKEEKITYQPLLSSKVITLKTLPAQDWYKSVKADLDKFYREYAKTPNNGLKSARQNVEINMKNIEMNLKTEGLCKKIEYTGSSYEGLKITEDGLEFDVMFIIDGKDIEIIELEKYPGFASLKIKNGVTHSKLQNFIDLKTRFLLPHLFMENFLKDVKGIVGKFNEGKRMELIRTGPSACLNMFQENEILFSVDLVPAFEIDNQGEMVRYIAKPVTSSKSAPNASNSWRRSFSREEKELLKRIDKNNECRRKTVQILKAIFKRDTYLKRLSSFHLKAVLLHAVEQKVALEWHVNSYERVFDMLGFTQQFLEEKFLPNYFIRSMNVLYDFDDDLIANILESIKNLRNNKDHFLQAIA